MTRPDPPSAGEHLPLKPVVFEILLALVDRDSHGYGIIVTVREQSNGLVTLPTGAFYRHLAWAIKHGLVEESNSRPASDDVRRGAYYRLTSRGRDLLSRESDRLDRAVSVARAKGLLSQRRSA